MARVQLHLGDMFDGPSDLIVLPCSTSGTITSFVRERLVHHRIPYPKPGMRLGDVSIVPFDGGENIAQYVAFAASVDGDRSTEEAIRRIGMQLGDCTQRGPTVRHVAAPLLGAGAGKLQSELVVYALSNGFKAAAAKDAKLIISVLHRAVFDRISAVADEMSADSRAQNEGLGQSETEPLRVFMSYSHSSTDHEQWVERLATFLRSNGIDARLDTWHLRRGMDLPQWMTNELSLAHRVVLVSDERYTENADGRVGGVGWETMIVQGDLSRLPPNSVKYLVIVRAAAVDAGLPKYLKTKFAIHWPNDAAEARNRTILLKELFDRVGPPPLGPKPTFL